MYICATYYTSYVSFWKLHSHVISMSMTSDNISIVLSKVTRLRFLWNVFIICKCSMHIVWSETIHTFTHIATSALSLSLSLSLNHTLTHTYSHTHTHTHTHTHSQWSHEVNYTRGEFFCIYVMELLQTGFLLVSLISFLRNIIQPTLTDGNLIPFSILSLSFSLSLSLSLSLLNGSTACSCTYKHKISTQSTITSYLSTPSKTGNW